MTVEVTVRRTLRPVETAPDPTAATGKLTHVDATGAARMVDVSGKEVTVRRAVAAGSVAHDGRGRRSAPARGAAQG